MKTNKSFITSVGAALLLSVSAQAQVVLNDSTSFEFGSVNTLEFSQFDTLGGTRSLTGVTVELSFTLPAQTVDVTNNLSGAANVSGVFAEFDTNVFSASVDTAQDLSNPNIVSGDFTVSSENFSFTGVPAGDTVSYNTTPVSISLSRNVDSSLWAQYVGGGTITFDLEKNFSATATASGGGAGSTTTSLTLTTGGYSGTVTYDFETNNVIPEPGTFGALAVLGSFGLLVLRRRGR